MRKIHTTKLLAATLIASGLMGAASSAFADEYVTQANKEQYAVSAGTFSAQPLLPQEAGPTSYDGARYIRTAPTGFEGYSFGHAPYGPFSDRDPHSGPSQNG